MPAEATRTVLVYMRAIHEAEGEGQPVPTAAIAARLGRRAASVAGMIRRLRGKGWVRYEPRSGVRFTPSGLIEAQRATRRLQLLERFLASALGFHPAEARAEAESILHATSARLERALTNYLEESGGEPIDCSS